MNWRSPQPVVCWEAAEANAVLPVEAEAVPPHLFQATHVPLRLHRVNPSAVSTLSEATESETAILSYLQGRVRDRSTDVIPILGDSGAGKSHLVRWLRNALEDDPIEKCRVVFIPKHRTSLRGVVELILDAFSDVPELDAVRDRLMEASDLAYDEKGLRTKLRDELCFGLEHEPDRTQVPPEVEGAREYLAKGLPALLRDAQFAPRYLADDAAIAKLVREKLVGRAGDDAVESAYEFGPDDVSVSDDEFNRASSDAQEAASALLLNAQVGDDRTTQELAALMLNDQLPAALRRVFGIGGEDLKDLFISARKVLEGHEDILLLVEDFAMFQGLQRGLLDAITTHSTQHERLCHLVTVFAVTTGYYSRSLPDTLHTRCSAAFVVGGQGPDAPVHFAASYLRAIRLGVDEVAMRHQGDGAGSSCEGCPVIEECHEGFGSHDGEGLFPFTPTMLNRASEAALGTEFNARSFLNQVMRPVLVEDRTAIVEGQFPSEEFAHRFNASRNDPGGDVLVRLRQEDEGRRRVRLALMYRDPVDDGDLPTAIHDAFAVEPLGRSGGEPTSTTVPTADDEGRPSGKAIPPLVAALDEWRRNGQLAQKHRQEVRRLVTEAVTARIDFNDGNFRPNAWLDAHPPFIHVGRGGYNSVVLDGDGKPPTGAVRLDLSWENAEQVDAIQSLAWLSFATSWRRVPGGVERAGRLESVLTQWTETVIRQLGLHHGLEDDLVAVVEAIEVVHAVAGRRADGTPARLALLLDDLPEGHGIDPRLEAAHRILLSELRRRLAYARGATGSVVAVDIRLGQHLLRRARGGVSVMAGAWERGRGGKAKTSVQALAEVRGLCVDVANAGDRLAGLLPDLDALGDDDPEPLAGHIAGVCKGRAPADQLRELRRLGKTATTEDVTACRKAADELRTWDELSVLQKVLLANGPWRSSAERLTQFTRVAESVLAAATPTGAVLGKSEQSQVVDAWQSTLADVDGIIRVWKEVRT